MSRLRWEEADPPAPPHPEGWPTVTVLVPAHNEEAVIRRALTAVLAMDYPDLEVIVVDDGSTDRTVDALVSLIANSRIRLVRKVTNEGKALALNDALPLARGELVLILDADAEPAPDMLHWLVPHFQHARVAAVTGNPRVRNTESFIARLQAMEFSSIVSLLRRSQRIWGRITTVSGVVTLLRRSAVLDVGGFSPNMPTEDIELTWKLQKRFYDVRYEPRAICWMTVPLSYKGLWHQRLRWSRGLMQVMRKHADILAHWRLRRMWPVFCRILPVDDVGTVLRVADVDLGRVVCGRDAAGQRSQSQFMGNDDRNVVPFATGRGRADRSANNKSILRFYPYAVWYPILYWMFLAMATVIALPYLIRRPGHDPVTWTTQRAGSGS